MKFYKLLSIILVIVLIVVAIYLYFMPDRNILLSNNTINNHGFSTNYLINQSILITNITSRDDVHINDSCDNLQLINGDYVFNNINWSRYPNIEKICIQNNEISGPTSIINHTHIWFSINVNVKDPENIQELNREMAGIVIEIRQMIGPNSTPDVWGLVNGVESYHAGMMPYDNKIYLFDHYHPQAYKNEIYLIPGDDIYDYNSYTLINNSVVEK